MAIIINPGSQISATEGAVGWTNTHDQALKYAVEWFDRMAASGFVDVTMDDPGTDDNNGRWLFTFTHDVTGKTVELYTHGIDDLDAYEKQCIFGLRVYWNGSSSADPELDDFKADGFEPIMTYRKVDEQVTTATTTDSSHTEPGKNAPSDPSDPSEVA